jgi:hypothetical protein
VTAQSGADAFLHSPRGRSVEVDASSLTLPSPRAGRVGLGRAVDAVPHQNSVDADAGLTGVEVFGGSRIRYNRLSAFPPK